MKAKLDTQKYKSSTAYPKFVRQKNVKNKQQKEKSKQYQ